VLSWCGPLLLGSALLCWPYRPGRSRVAAIHGAPLRRQRWRDGLHRPPALLVAVLAGGAGLSVAGPAGSVAAAVTATTAILRLRARRRAAAALAATAELAAALGLLGAELRAGGHPAQAAERVAADAAPVAARVLGSVAITARLGGDVAAVMRRQAGADPALVQPLDQLAAAWSLASRHGIPLADVLEAVRGDLQHRVRASQRLNAALAGPRATALVLAGLPVLGLLLGQLVGARPWLVLTRVAAGQLLLALGAVLTCAGLFWSARLTAKASAS
jgi:tight adherence protein B